MVESVDTRDLKSRGHCGCAGSSPAPSTRKQKDTKAKIITFMSFYFIIALTLLHRPSTFKAKNPQQKIYNTENTP